MLSYPEAGLAVIGVAPPGLLIYDGAGAFLRQEALELRGFVPVSHTIAPLVIDGSLMAAIVQSSDGNETINRYRIVSR